MATFMVHETRTICEDCDRPEDDCWCVGSFIDEDEDDDDDDDWEDEDDD